VSFHIFTVSCNKDLDMRSNEDIDFELNLVLGSPGCEMCCAEVVDGGAEDEAIVRLYYWYESTMRMGPRWNDEDYVVDRSWVVGQVKRLPDRTSVPQFIVALRMSHPELVRQEKVKR